MPENRQRYWHCTMGCAAYPKDTKHDDCPKCGHPLIRSVPDIATLKRELTEPDDA